VNSRPNASADEEDRDATARLPTLDPPPGAADNPDPLDAAVTAPVPAIPVGTLELADRLREIERRLDLKGQRVSQLEEQLEQAAAKLTFVDSQLTESRARQVELEAQLEEARAHAQMQSQLVLERRSTAVRYREQDFSDLRNRTERQLEALSSWEGFRAVSDALLDDAEARNALLEARVSSLTDSVRILEGTRPRSSPQGQSEALKSEVRALQALVTSLRAELAVARKVPAAAHAPLNAGTESKVAPPGGRKTPVIPDASDAPVNATVVMYGDQWEYSEEPGDAATGEVEQVSEPVADAPVRALVRLASGGELIYPIGKRTTIGRTADNDIQIDVPNVSRHHAVLLANPRSCRIEDLNSTNGVMVNGQRVTRQELQDGDTVTIGKSEFRFMQRS
jgi:hypothetical protein